MAFKRKEINNDTPTLEMTPMIDVVFQLLIFFVVTLKQEDILSKLEVARPATSSETKITEQIQTTTIIVESQGFALNGKYMPRPSDLDRELKRISTLSKTAMVLVKCTKDSPHGLLVQALDLCNKHGLTNIAIFTI